ncbi:MAG: AAA family ATPase [Bacteroidia bacterium]
MNNNHLHHVRIENFKSIKQVSFDCKRVNVFIGKPNVGKSNILEALGMLSPLGNLKDYVRFNKAYELFYDNDTSVDIKIITDNLSIIAGKYNLNNEYLLITGKSGKGLENVYNNQGLSGMINLSNFVEAEIDNEFITNSTQDFTRFSRVFQTTNLLETNVRKYQFKSLDKYNEGFSDFLSAPFGNNIWNVLNTNRKLREQVSELFVEYGLRFIMLQSEEKFVLQKEIDNVGFQYDYSLIADTLQRIIFHYAAIASNTNAVLLFEEPESHSYPGYISDLGIEIANSETNQFFIATHSPYLLSTLMENLSYEDCAIFVCSYENYQTHVKELSKEEVSEAIDYGQDLFMNIDTFIEHV